MDLMRITVEAWRALSLGQMKTDVAAEWDEPVTLALMLLVVAIALGGLFGLVHRDK